MNLRWRALACVGVRWRALACVGVRWIAELIDEERAELRNFISGGSPQVLKEEQCLARRIRHRATVEREIAAWQTARNASGEQIRSMFKVERPRDKMARAYPVLEYVRMPTAMLLPAA